MVEGLTQQIKLLEKNSELESKHPFSIFFSPSLPFSSFSFNKFSHLSCLIDSEKLKEVMTKEAIITKLKEECQNKDRSIEYLTTRQKEVLATFEKKCEGNRS